MFHKWTVGTVAEFPTWFTNSPGSCPPILQNKIVGIVAFVAEYFLDDGMDLRRSFRHVSIIEPRGTHSEEAAGATVRHFSFPANSTGDITRDGQRFLMNMPLDRGNQMPITIVLNWQAALER